MTRLLLKTRYRFALLFFLFSLGISLVTRLALLSTHHGWTKPWAATALAVGEVYDLLAALWLTLPLFLFLTVLPERWFQTRWLRAALWFYSAAAVFALLFVSVIEGFFFAEFDGRFNFVAVDYLMFPTEVVTNIWESYPTGWIVAGLAVLSTGAVFLMRHQIRRSWEEPAHPLRRAQLTALYAGVLAAATWTVSPSLAQVSQDRALNEIALCDLSVNAPLVFDAYDNNRGTGAFIFIDRLTNNTVGAGLLDGEVPDVVDDTGPAHRRDGRDGAPDDV